MCLSRGQSSAHDTLHTPHWHGRQIVVFRGILKRIISAIKSHPSLRRLNRGTGALLFNEASSWGNSSWGSFSSTSSSYQTSEFYRLRALPLDHWHQRHLCRGPVTKPDESRWRPWCWDLAFYSSLHHFSTPLFNTLPCVSPDFETRKH